MRYRNKRGWSIEAALTVALFLVIQAFFSGLSLGARADTLASSGPVLCLGGSAAVAVDPSAPAPRDHLDCCTLGCPMLGGLPGPEGASAALPSVLAATAPYPRAEGHHPGRFELSPLHSRAPPEA